MTRLTDKEKMAALEAIARVTIGKSTVGNVTAALPLAEMIVNAEKIAAATDKTTSPADLPEAAQTQKKARRR